VVATSHYSSLFLLSVCTIRLIGRCHFQEFLTGQSQAEERKTPTRCRDHCLRFEDVGQAIGSQTKPIQSIRASLGEGASTRTGGIKRQSIKLVHTKLRKSGESITCVLDQNKKANERTNTIHSINKTQLRHFLPSFLPSKQINLLLQSPIG
jgi:hypothetical protein